MNKPSINAQNARSVDRLDAWAGAAPDGVEAVDDGAVADAGLEAKVGAGVVSANDVVVIMVEEVELTRSLVLLDDTDESIEEAGVGDDSTMPVVWSEVEYE
jgi:hypothetical protein